MNIRNDFDEVIGVDCDYCLNPLETTSKGYYKGFVIINLVTIEDGHICEYCHRGLKNEILQRKSN